MRLVAELKRRNVFRMAILYGVSGWLLLQAGDVLFDLLNLPDWSLRLLLAILLLGFPVALIFSWVYEMTPEGLKKEREVDHGQSITGHTAKKLDLAVIGLGVVALVVFGADRGGLIPHGGSDTNAAQAPAPVVSELEQTEPPAPEDSSIAVLPFINMSSDPEQEYFSDGLTESLLHLLAQINELRVAARTSSFRFKNQNAGISDIGRQLNVAHVLEGSVRRSGDTLRVTAQLIKVDDGYHLWSGTYDRQMNDIFAIQDDIATRVVEALKTALLGTAAGNDLEVASASLDTDNLEAYEAYLRGREQLHIDSYVSLPQAEAYFQQALQLDPEYELALIALGETYVSMATTGQLTEALAVERLSEVGQRIIQRNPDSAPGQVILGWAQFRQRQNPESTRQIFRRAYETDPEHPFVALSYGTYLDFAGRQAEAAVVLERALLRDPMSPDIHIRLALSYDRFEPDKALLHAARGQALEPGNPNALFAAAGVYAQAGHYVEAIKILIRARALDPADPELPTEIARNLIAFGQLEAARDHIAQGRAISPSAALPMQAEVALLQREGNREGAAALARKIIDDGIEPRRWGYPLVIAVLQDQAVRSGDADVFVRPLGNWLQVDFEQPQIGGRETFAKLMAVPALRTGGRSDLADAIVAAAEANREDYAADDLVLLAIATRDVDLLVNNLKPERSLNSLGWLFMSLESVRSFAGDNPRFRERLKLLADNEREQARLWAQHQDDGG